MVAEREESFTDHQGELTSRPPKRRKIFEEADVHDIQVSYEEYEARISSIVSENYEKAKEHGQLELSNPQGGEDDFMRDDDFMKAGVADITACVDEVLLQRALNQRALDSK